MRIMVIIWYRLSKKLIPVFIHFVFKIFSCIFLNSKGYANNSNAILVVIITSCECLAL